MVRPAIPEILDEAVSQKRFRRGFLYRFVLKSQPLDTSSGDSNGLVVVGWQLETRKKTETIERET